MSEVNVQVHPLVYTEARNLRFMWELPPDVVETKMTRVQSMVHGCWAGAEPIYTKAEPDVEIDTQKETGLGDHPGRKKIYIGWESHRNITKMGSLHDHLL